MTRQPAYPFVPKSTTHLIPGQFWAVPLKDGRFACGRVIELGENEEGKRHTRTFLGALMDWCGHEPPTVALLEGRKVLEEGAMHIRAILQSGGSILGYRPLELEGIEPRLCMSQAGGRDCWLMRGFKLLRPVTAADQTSHPLTASGLQRDWAARRVTFRGRCVRMDGNRPPAPPRVGGTGPDAVTSSATMSPRPPAAPGAQPRYFAMGCSLRRASVV